MRYLPVAIVSLAVLVSPVEAQQGSPMPENCGTRMEILNALAKKYDEYPVAVGLRDNGSLIEILTSRQGQTWTALITMPGGISCLVSSGTNWEPRERLPGPPA